jgi:hypothetical protein
MVRTSENEESAASENEESASSTLVDARQYSRQSPSHPRTKDPWGFQERRCSNCRRQSLIRLRLQSGRDVCVHRGQRGSALRRQYILAALGISSQGYRETHLSVPGEVDLECLAVILETKRRHGEEDIFAVDGLALLLLAFLRS